VVYSLEVPLGGAAGEPPVRVRFVGRDDLVVADEGGKRSVEDWKASGAAVKRDPSLLVVRAYALAEEAGHGATVEEAATRVIDGGRTPRQAVTMDATMRTQTQHEVASAARAIATLDLPMAPREGDGTCANDCDPNGVCGRYQAARERREREERGQV